MAMAGLAGLAIGLTPPGFLLRLAILGTLGATASVFRSLTVEVTDSKVTWRFGDGAITKSIPRDDIDSAYTVRTTPLQGWGIHWIGDGWLYNIYGLHAVQLILKDGKRVLIGTDDPENLAQAINAPKQITARDEGNLLR